MEKIYRFEDIADAFYENGKPDQLFINVQDESVLEYMFPGHYDQAMLNEYWSHSKLGYLYGAPVFKGILSRKSAKIVWH